MHILPLSKYNLIFPDPSYASDEGLLAYGGDLSVNRIMAGYSKGIFPWFNEDDPILWWSPNPRFILKIDDLHISKNLKKTIRKNIFEVKFNTNFRSVMENCAKVKRADQEGSWITNDMIEAYCELHASGFAHSFESYFEGELVGGGYGVMIGDIFCGESMFSLKSDSSKIAFVSLVNRLKANGFSLIDSQIHTPYLESFGAIHISRDKYLKLVKEALSKPRDF
ncbi:MAG: leucyl/phenylalanyl-tRNA--protein transferase [Campylobacterota bacterium]|nr:leucyl/phenylalanyl-tRNA--protein transferase [Campylobacterota bacterium]